jgi:ketosteroid isomerase-like protein
MFPSRASSTGPPRWGGPSVAPSVVLGFLRFLKFEPQDFLAKGDKVVVLGERQIRTRQRGIEYGGPMAQVITVQGGKLKRFEDFGDTAQLANAFKSK